MSIVRSLLLFVVLLPGFLAHARRDSIGIEDCLIMLATTDFTPAVAEARIGFLPSARRAVAEMGFSESTVVEAIRYNYRSPFSLIGENKPHGWMVFMGGRDARKPEATVFFTLKNGRVRVVAIRRYLKRDQWAWKWSNYQTTSHHDDLPRISHDALATGKRMGFGAAQILEAFANPVRPPIPSHEFPNLKWHVGRAEDGSQISVIYRSAPHVRDYTIFKAVRVPTGVLDKFVLLSAQDRQDVIVIANGPYRGHDVRMIPNLLGKLAWKHQVSMAELVLALEDPGPVVRVRDASSERGGPPRYRFITKIPTGRELQIVFAIEGGHALKIISAFDPDEAGRHSYARAVAELQK